MSSAIALVSVCAAAQCSTALVQSAPEGDVTHRRCGCCTTASAARCPTAHRLLSVAYTAADAYSGSSAAQRSRALTAVSEVKRSSEAWFALGLARVIGTANAKGEFAADRTGLTGARERRLYRYSGVQRAMNSHTATAVGPLGSRKERFVVFVRQPHCRLRRRLCRLYVALGDAPCVTVTR